MLIEILAGTACGWAARLHQEERIEGELKGPKDARILSPLFSCRLLLSTML